MSTRAFLSALALMESLTNGVKTASAISLAKDPKGATANTRKRPPQAEANNGLTIALIRNRSLANHLILLTI